jgi:hypothetical protein
VPGVICKFMEMNATSPLEREFRYYLAHQDELVRQYSGKVLAIKGQKVIGVFDSEAEAVHTTAKAHELGTFIVQRCEPGRDAYTRTFHSPVFR